MKRSFVLSLMLPLFLIISFCLSGSDIKAADNHENNSDNTKLTAPSSVFVPVLNKKVQFIDVDFSVWVDGQYKTTYKETSEVETEDRSDAVNAGGECSLSTLTRNGLASYEMNCSKNVITVKYTVPETYISKKGEYSLILELAPDGKSIKSLNVKFAGGTEIEKVTYNLTAADLPWFGSLGKDFDKSQRQYRFKMSDGKPIQHIDYEKVKENPGTTNKYTATSIDMGKNQMLTVYFYYAK